MSHCDDDRATVSAWLNAVGYLTRASDTSNTDETPGYIVACYPSPTTDGDVIGIRYYGKKGGKRSQARLAEEFERLTAVRDTLARRFTILYPVALRNSHHVLYLTPQQVWALAELVAISKRPGVRLDILTMLERLTQTFRETNDLTQLAAMLRDLTRLIDGGY